MCSYDDYCAKQVSYVAPDIELFLCALGVRIPEPAPGFDGARGAQPQAVDRDDLVTLWPLAVEAAHMKPGAAPVDLHAAAGRHFRWPEHRRRPTALPATEKSCEELRARAKSAAA
jgi:hypothetical protein